MAKIRPFCAIRPAEQWVSQVASLPYDVMNTEEARKMATNNPLSYLHIDRAEIDFPQGENPYSNQVYQKAKENLERMQKEGTLFQEKCPSFYIYQLKMGEHVQSGIVACASIEEYENGQIKKHEFTRPEKEEDRIRHMDACEADTSPVFLTYRNQNEIDDFVLSIEKHQSPLYDFLSEDGIHHTVWAIKEPKDVHDLQTLFQKVPALYIADGHHRAASAYKVAQMRRLKETKQDPEAPYNYFLTVLFPDNQLYVMDYNRVVKYKGALNFSSVLSRMEENFIVTPLGKSSSPSPKKIHEFSLYEKNTGWYQLIARPSVIDEKDPINRLDVSILQNSFLAPILGIDDPRTDKNIDFVGGIRGLTELAGLVDCGKWDIAIALYPTSIEDVMSIADTGLVMPPKSTWFEPKLRSGLFVYSLK